MSALEHYAPLAEVSDPALSTARLLNDFKQFAYNNKPYQAGLIDRIYIKTMEGDQLEEDVVPTDEISVGYTFEANRLRQSFKPTRPELIFDLTVLATRDAIEIPAHIAMDQYSCDDPAMAVDQAGLGSLEHGKRFTISSHLRYLEVCESYTYKNDEAEILAHCCTCPDHPEDSPVEINDRDIDVEGAAILASMETVFKGKNEALVQDQNLLEAHRSFLLFKRGLQRQLGL